MRVALVLVGVVLSWLPLLFFRTSVWAGSFFLVVFVAVLSGVIGASVGVVLACVVSFNDSPVARMITRSLLVVSAVPPAVMILVVISVASLSDLWGIVLSLALSRMAVALALVYASLSHKWMRQVAESSRAMGATFFSAARVHMLPWIKTPWLQATVESIPLGFVTAIIFGLATPDSSSPLRNALQALSAHEWAAVMALPALFSVASGAIVQGFALPSRSPETRGLPR